MPAPLRAAFLITFIGYADNGGIIKYSFLKTKFFLQDPCIHVQTFPRAIHLEGGRTQEKNCPSAKKFNPCTKQVAQFWVYFPQIWKNFKGKIQNSFHCWTEITAPG